MPNPRQARAGQSGYSPRLGRRDPRVRTNADAARTDQDLDGVTLKRDARGRTRVALFDGIVPLGEGASLADVRAAVNAMIRMGRTGR